jgi:hypothetical protein
MLRKFTVTTAATVISLTVLAQDSSSTASSFKLSGSADVYYRYNFNNPKNPPYNNLTSFTTSHNSFELGMASIKAEHSIGKVGMVADLGFGQRADDFSYTDYSGNSVSRFAVKQLFVTYAPSDKIKFTFGEWATHIGYELVDAYLNRNYSMSYMFSYGPFLHTGIKADISLGGKNALMLGIANPTDYKTAPHMPKTIIAQFSTASKDDKLKAYFNFQGGKQTDSAKLYQGDVVLTYAVTNKFSLGYNGTLQSRSSKSGGKWGDGNSWWGSALYVNVDPISWFGLTLRGEYINDKKEVLGIFGENGSGFESTLSANFKIDNLTIIPEFRLDHAKNEVFYKSETESIKSTGSFILAATYHF